MIYEVNIDLSPLKKVVDSFDAGGATQHFFTSELMRLSDNYVPMESSALKTSAQMGQDGASIIYDTPYATYQWYGRLMVDPITGKGAFFKEGYGFWSRPNTPKVLTSKPLKYHGSSLRGSHWAERCFMDNKDYFIESTLKFAEELAK